MPNFTPKTIWEGRDLMLFDSNGKSYAYATNHTVTLNFNTSDISSKDHGIWGSTTITNIGWEISTENLATEEYNTLFNLSIAHEPITVKFGLKKDEASEDILPADGDIEAWSINDTVGDIFYEGKALITGLTLNAQNGEKANYQLTLSGVSKLQQKTVTQ